MLGFFFYQTAAILASLFPVKVLYFFARRLSEMKYLTDKTARNSVRSNLEYVLPQALTVHERRRIEVEVFRNFACFIVDFLWLSRSSSRLKGTTAKIEGWEHVQSALDRQKGVIFLTAHLGNWELGASLLARAGFEIKVIAQKHENPRINRFFNQMRERFGVGVLQNSGSKDGALRWLRKRGCLGILADRELGGSGGQATFFGRQTMLPRAHVALALRTGASLLPGFIVRDEEGRYRAIVRPAIDLSDLGKTGAAVRIGVERCLHVFEEFIKLYPEQWFVFRRVWPERSSSPLVGED